jgi:hypothetical protein
VRRNAQRGGQHNCGKARDNFISQRKKPRSDVWFFSLDTFMKQRDYAPVTVSSESKDVRWIPLEKVNSLNADESLVRMVGKTWCGSEE